MAVCTLEGHVSRALDFYNKENIFVCIGKKNPWNEDTVDSYDSNVDYDRYPPVPKNTDTIIEPIGYKKIDSRFMVVEDNVNGSLEYRGTRWRIVSPDNAITEGARWVYITTELSYSELPTSDPYRQVGIYTGLTPIESKLSENVLLPDEVENTGILEIIDNRKPVYRDSDVKEKIKLVLEF